MRGKVLLPDLLPTSDRTEVPDLAATACRNRIQAVGIEVDFETPGKRRQLCSIEGSVREVRDASVTVVGEAEYACVSHV